MGGCRCTYRTCKATTDGNTHFFHYPVFDKHRCHQWIANAQRFDLLELKLSQLKNRVICQHHFQDNMFMNDMKNKLTHNAVPTLDGPFVAVKSSPEAPPIVPTDISVSNALQEIVTNKEKIEDDTKYFTSREKIATFSVPYNEFLKKCDLDQLNDPDLLKSMPTHRKKQPLYTNRLIVTEPQADSRTDSVDVHTKNAPPQAPSQSVERAKGKKQKKNVVIIAEKKITNQLPIKPPPGELKKVSPNFVIKKPKKEVAEPIPANLLPNAPNEPTGNSNVYNINVPKYYTQNPAVAGLTVQTPSRRAMTAQQTQQVNSNPIQEDSNQYLPQIVSVNSIPSAANNCVVHPTVLDVEFVPEVARVPLEQGSTAATPQNTTKNPVSTSAEKINTAANTEYSSRMREVVEKALSRLDEQRRKQVQVQSKSPHNVHRRQPSPVSFKSKHICKNPKKPNSLTAALLAKVKENSRDIAEIKHLLQEQVKSAGKNVKTVKDKNVEVYSDPESRKQYLFKEISQYLSSKLKSELYEELFINHLVPNTRSSSSRRKTSPKFT